MAKQQRRRRTNALSKEQTQKAKGEETQTEEETKSVTTENTTPSVDPQNDINSGDEEPTALANSQYRHEDEWNSLGDEEGFDEYVVLTSKRNPGAYVVKTAESYQLGKTALNHEGWYELQDKNKAYEILCERLDKENNNINF